VGVSESLPKGRSSRRQITSSFFYEFINKRASSQVASTNSQEIKRRSKQREEADCIVESRDSLSLMMKIVGIALSRSNIVFQKGRLKLLVVSQIEVVNAIKFTAKPRT